MKKFISTAILFFYFLITFSQVSENFDRHIIWKKNIYYQSDTENSADIYYLNFENAVYENLSDFLPSYYEQIFLSDEFLNTDDVEVKLENMNFIALSDDELKGVKYLENLNDELKLSYNIFSSRQKSYLVISFIPLISENGKYKKLIDFNIKVEIKKKNKETKSSKNSFAENSVLSSGKWVKIKILQEGVYKLTYSDMQTLGFDNPSNVRVFGNNFGMQPFINSQERADDLIENKIFKGSDYILFYAKNQNVWYYDEENQMFLPKNHLYADAAFYFLTDRNTGWDNSILIENQSTQTANINVNSYDAYQNHEIDTVNLLKSGRTWYGENFEYQSSQNFVFNFDNILLNTVVKLNISMIARSSSTSTYTVTSDNFSDDFVLGTVTGTHTSAYARTGTKFYNYTTVSSDAINLDVDYQGIPSAKGWLDYIVYNTRCSLKYNSEQLIFRDINSVETGNISNFNLSSSNSSVIIWDITNSEQPKKINSTFSGTTTSFKIETDSLREFVAFELTNTLSPVLTGEGTGTITNQNLHGTSGNIDMVIFTHPNFLSQAEELAEIHRINDNLIVSVVTTDQVYNEFSSGMPDVSAIKYFVKMIYDRGGTDPIKYLLLFGDGSYKNRGKELYNYNFILTYQSDTSTNENNTLTFVSDDYFGMLDDNEGEYTGLLDIGIGRFPVKSTTEASNIIDKIESYMNKENMDDSRNVICFVADDEDSRIHMTQAENLYKKIDTIYPEFNVKKIYLDAYVQEASANGDSYPAAGEAVNNKIEQGVIIFDYIGHGSVDRLTHEAVITIPDINNWSNFKHLPLFITATCEFSRYDDYSYSEDATSAGEFVFLNPNGGAIAMLTTTRVVYSGDNYELNDNFYNYVFEKENGLQIYRLGDLVRLTKNATGGKNQLNFTLLGDPALKLNLPEYNIKTTKINNIDIEGEIDTLKSLSKVTIDGVVTDNNDNILTNFNGIVIPSVYDKKQIFQTLDNDGIGPFTYAYQNNLLYNGRASVTNGKFSFSFIVPKDILYNFGNGKLSYYATDYNTDATGVYTDFIIGGSSDSFYEDATGPEINLFINDENFVSGGITDRNPVIYALVSDTSGINTVGSGIGHDITAVIDNNVNDTKILNDYYEAALDDYQNGKIMYNLYKLDEGEHNIKLKVWDVYNNSSSQEIDLLVINDDDFTIDRLYNYPNPFTTHTEFYFEHNQPGVDLDVLIQIFTVSGKLVKTIEYQMFSTGYKSDGIEWDGSDDYGDKIGKGVYIYRVKLKKADGLTVEKFEKLLILK